MTMSECDRYSPDNVFKRFKVVEFPTSFVGLSTSQELDVEVDLNATAYLKTMYEGRLWKFEDARTVSASHRAFDITPKDNHTINITFKPLSECISRLLKQKKHLDNRFVFDLRLIKVDGFRCCNNEIHSEIGRYYISGQFEYCNISHHPKKINFGEVDMKKKVTRYLYIQNESHIIPAKVNYVKVVGIEVTPQSFTVTPKTTKKVAVSIKPNSLKMANSITFKIRNPHDLYEEPKYPGEKSTDANYILHTISFEINVNYKMLQKEVLVESLHKLYERYPCYTFMDEQLTTHERHKELADQLFKFSKSTRFNNPPRDNKPTGQTKCFSDLALFNFDPGYTFCQKSRERATGYDLLNIEVAPLSMNFGRIAVQTYGEQNLMIKNNSKYDIAIKFLNDKYIVYNSEKLSDLSLKLKPFSETNVSILCYGVSPGNYKGTFNYTLEHKYHRLHPYTLQVGNPTLMIYETNLKFGMVTTECFVTSIPVRIYNSFNVPVNFEWEELHSETPFEIIPTSGTIPKHTCKICDIIYVCKATKTKTHEIEFTSKGQLKKVIPLELCVMTRKLSIKFLQQTVIFKDIPLNIETIERVKLENSSREIALFHVVEPLIPGLRIEPMSGIIRPKMLITFEIVVQICCVLEFCFDVTIKINNKENVILPISGNVVEPKLIISPKNIYMARVPCNMVTYIPITFQNISSLKTLVEVLDTGDENIFNVYQSNGNERQRLYEFTVDGGQTKIVFLKVFDIFRREYEMYIPFKINGFLGPPNQNTWSTELQSYIGPYEQLYESNLKVKVKTINKDIAYCRIIGVITVPWISFSVDKFEIDYVPNGSNSITFTMTNVSKYYLHITILTSKLAPNFSLDLHTEENQSIINETNIKFELSRGQEAAFCLKFHPKGHGRFISIALLFLDKYLNLPYYNLTFIGKRQAPVMTPSTYRIIFPPCYVGKEISRDITVKMETAASLDTFHCSSKEEPNLSAKFISCEIVREEEFEWTILTIRIAVCCKTIYSRNLTLSFNHEGGSGCDVEVNFCFTNCPITLHTNSIVKPEDNPYPYYPLKNQTDLYEYVGQTLNFLEKWMFQQGFRRDLYPVIPDTFHAISSALTSQVGAKSKGINVSYLNFVRRIAGPLMKYVRKISLHGVDDSFRSVKEIHDTYREIVHLLKSRGATLWVLQAKFLLSYSQFVTYSENVTPKCNADIILTQELLSDKDLFDRLNKQSWIDFLLQSYKVFVMDSCFFDCVCVSSQPRDVIKVIVDWYNEHIMTCHEKLRGKNRAFKVISNITTDLADGIAIISTFLNYCPFLEKHFSIYYEVDEGSRKGGIINNTCLIIEAMNILRLYFPLNSVDFLKPNFLQMLFLSIHLYVTLPMFKPKDIIQFHPPLLRSSTRQIAIAPTSQESLLFNFIILNNTKNCFIVEKAPSGDNGKKIYISVKYTANFIEKEEALLLVHGYNKTRIFDTYIVFELLGNIGALNPLRKCKVTGPLYRANKVDIPVSSPFPVSAIFQVYVTDLEPTIPCVFEDISRHRFYVRRLNIIEKEISLNAMPKDSVQEFPEHKLYLQMICLSTQIGNSWIWFRSEIGEFFIRVTTQPRWDLVLDTLQAKVQSWPMDPCSCGESCECYRSTILMIPHRNELMLKSLRYALLENASEVMMRIFDELIESATGKIILGMLLLEGGTNIYEVQHILRRDVNYRITSRNLIPRLEQVTLSHHSDAMLALPITVPPNDKSEKYSVTLTSDTGMDIRTYRIIFIEQSKAAL